MNIYMQENVMHVVLERKNKEKYQNIFFHAILCANISYGNDIIVMCSHSLRQSLKMSTNIVFYRHRIFAFE